MNQNTNLLKSCQFVLECLDLRASQWLELAEPGLTVGQTRSQVFTLLTWHWLTYRDSNSNSHDSVYGAVIVAVHCHCESSPGSSDECSTQRQVAADCWTKPISMSQ